MSQEHLLEMPPTTEKWFTCDGQNLRNLALAGMLWLDHNRQHVNELNVFPVPDGDTGTNMLLTMRSAYKRIDNMTDEDHAGRMAGEIARGALMGARGNSGVILSQIWRGLAHSLKDKPVFNTRDLAAAIQEASDTAYRGVMRPVEGTILTVIRDSAEAAHDAARKSPDLRFVLERVVERGRQSLARTPELLPILKQAGVVDSGGQGLLYIWEGMLRWVNGDMGDLTVAQHSAETAPTYGGVTAQELARPSDGTIENPYDVQFILMGQNLDVNAVRERIDAMGDSTVVVGDETTIKVHIHVKDPGEPLSYGISLGHITDVVVENMQEQMEEMIAMGGVSRDELSAEIAPEATVEPGQIAVITVAPGAGLANIFRSLGVARVVDGGQTNNPSTEELFEALQDVPTNKILLLPNNKNIILAAEAARDLSTKDVIVVPTRTVAQGLSAMLALNPDGDLDAIAAEMLEIIEEVATGEITTATRTVQLNGVDVAAGQYIGIANGTLCASGSDIGTVLNATLTAMEVADREILTIYYGQDVSAEDAESLAADIENLYPDLEVEIHHGGQAHYYYILGAE
ncbi:MAG: DAK2 domain-containing protein [Anaerolineae bacterium]|nr:DAK2 domain-containing protein [Anaerolineae bacterium]